MSRPACILTLDVGSSSARARLFDRRLVEIPVDASATWPYGWNVEGGAMELPADRLLEGVAAVIDEGVAAAERAGAVIAAVGVTTFWHSLLGLDAGGAPVTPLFGWGDTRASSVLPRLADRLDSAAFHRRTGCFLSAEYPIAKIAWLFEEGPNLRGEVATWCSFGDYLESRLFGVRRTPLSIASGTGLLETRTGRWDPAVLNALSITADDLPELSGTDPVRGLQPEWSARWPRLASVPWYPAVGDGACANIGSGAVGRASPGLTVGTSAAVRIVHPCEDAVSAPEDLWMYRVDGDHCVVGSALSNGGNGLAFVSKLLAGVDLRDLDAALRSGSVTSESPLTVLPGLVNERGATTDRGTGAAVVGLDLATDPIEIAGTWLEAIARRVAEPFRRLEATFGEADEVRASGGAFRVLPGWTQTFADVLERPVILVESDEATSRGVAILTARTLGWVDSIVALPSPVLHRSVPDSERHRAHARAAARERKLAAALQVFTSPS